MAEAQRVRGSCLLRSPERYDNVVFLSHCGLGKREMEGAKDEEGDGKQKAGLVQIRTSWTKAICID